MRNFAFFAVLLAFLGASGCTHLTAMSDPALSGLWVGQPLSSNAIANATQNWPNEVALIEMQQAFALLKRGDLSSNTRADAKRYLERSVASFDDLKQPSNFSTAFSADANTPYKGRPYERVLASLFLGILDVADGRCDMAIPAFKTAEFLDARWQPFQFGSDAPLVYALTLRCLHQTRASSGDIDRAKDGLLRSIRLLQAVEGTRRMIAEEAYTDHVSLMLIDAGLSSALMEAESSANSSEILDRVVSDSMRYYVQVLADKNDPLNETLANKANAQDLVQMTNALKSIVGRANRDGRLVAFLSAKINEAYTITNKVVAAVTKPKAVLVFEGTGPRIVAEGEHQEIAKVVPASEELARPEVSFMRAHAEHRCGFYQESNTLTIVLCDEATAKLEGSGNSSAKHPVKGVKLWSSSYQATSMVGRRFDKVLKGRAVFRSGSESVALIGAATAVALLHTGNTLAQECQHSGRNCEAARNMQLAGAIAGVFAGGAWLAGRAVNPEADTRHLTNTFESGYLMLLRDM